MSDVDKEAESVPHGIVIARYEIVIQLDPDGDQSIWLQMNGGDVDPDNYPPIITTMGAFELAKDTAFRMYRDAVEEDENDG